MAWKTLVSGLALVGLALLFVDAPARPKAPRPARSHRPPPVLMLAGLKPGYDTISDAEKRYGPGLAVMGGHPRGGRLWRSRTTGWYLRVDGFDYRDARRKLDAVLDEITVSRTGDPNAPLTSLPLKEASLFGRLRLGMSEAEALTVLRARRIRPKREAGTLSWSQKGSARVNRDLVYRVWQATLNFDKQGTLDAIQIGCD